LEKLTRFCNRQRRHHDKVVERIVGNQNAVTKGVTPLFEAFLAFVRAPRSATDLVADASSEATGENRQARREVELPVDA
jgi:hypothetical protein